MIGSFEHNYRRVLHDIVNFGEKCENRTGIDTFVLFNQTFNIDLNEGFPAVTGKKVYFDKAYHEYMWIEQGLTTTKYLKENGIHWWDKFAVNGKLGKTYGYQLRNYNGEKDQLMMAVKEILANTRYAHITMWNPSDLEEQALPCCYTGFTFVRTGDKLSMVMEFRSSDVFLGLPYDIMCGAIMLYRVAGFTDLKVDQLGINLANAHVYENHVEKVKRYLELPNYPLPKISEDLKELIGYQSGPYIEAELN